MLSTPTLSPMSKRLVKAAFGGRKGCHYVMEAWYKYRVPLPCSSPGVGLSTVCVAVHDVCTAIVNNLLERYIKIPTGSDAQAVVDGFLCTWGFPQCFGAIDGTHIPIIAPRDNPLDYYNRKGAHPIVLQALVDYEYKFMNIYVGWPGTVHDARILANSVVLVEVNLVILYQTRSNVSMEWMYPL